MELNEFINTGISEGWVRDTGTFDEVFIDGGNRKCQKYDVRIDKLHYNVQNGRIARPRERGRAPGTRPPWPQRRAFCRASRSRRTG